MGFFGVLVYFLKNLKPENTAIFFSEVAQSFQRGAAAKTRFILILPERISDRNVEELFFRQILALDPNCITVRNLERLEEAVEIVRTQGSIQPVVVWVKRL